VTLRQARDSVR